MVLDSITHLQHVSWTTSMLIKPSLSTIGQQKALETTIGPTWLDETTLETFGTSIGKKTYIWPN
jgi:hypothetical protein